MIQTFEVCFFKKKISCFGEITAVLDRSTLRMLPMGTDKEQTTLTMNHTLTPLMFHGTKWHGLVVAIYQWTTFNKNTICHSKIFYLEAPFTFLPKQVLTHAKLLRLQLHVWSSGALPKVNVWSLIHQVRYQIKPSFGANAALPC